MKNKKITLDASQNINLDQIPDDNKETDIVNNEVDNENVVNNDENKEVDNLDVDDKKDDVEGSKNELDGKTYNELRKIAKEKGLTFARNVNKDELIKLINNAEQVNANAMSLDNKPISPIVLTNEKEEIPAGFIAVKTKPIMNEIKFYNGRGYKVIGNGRGIWCDNGQCFELNSLNN
ncbi:hypothetical protein [Methanoculleus sp.]|uniref:hypothetical protein n=1 Tax=Methanoculleus sp. TaxID=90427 RepID=UPI0025EAFEC9|nr:hypothetical protein [Methanoculleus sp.]MCK9319975.1 hypothetical protein [Methanoculleus sp.]